MMPVIVRLLDRIREERVESVRAELSAELVCYWARTGDIEGSERQLQDLRARFGQGNLPRVSVWLMIADGITSYFGYMSEAARDRFVRANTISKMAKFDDLSRLSSAWLAYIDFNKNDYKSMGQDIINANPDPSRGDAADCRALVALGDACICGGAFADAVKWHEAARQIAVKLGDEATIGAIMYNKATFNCLRVQTNIALGVSEGAPLQFMEMQVDSTDYFHRAANNTALIQSTHVLKARRFIVAGKYSEAAELLSGVIQSGLPTSLLDDVELLRAELALCQLRVGLVEQAQAGVRQLLSETSPTLSPESEAIFWYCLNEVVQHGIDEAQRSQVTQMFLNAKARCQAERALLQTVLQDIHQALPELTSPRPAA